MVLDSAAYFRRTLETSEKSLMWRKMICKGIIRALRSVKPTTSTKSLIKSTKRNEYRRTIHPTGYLNDSVNP